MYQLNYWIINILYQIQKYFITLTISKFDMMIGVRIGNRPKLDPRVWGLPYPKAILNLQIWSKQLLQVVKIQSFPHNTAQEFQNVYNWFTSEIIHNLLIHDNMTACRRYIPANRCWQNLILTHFWPDPVSPLINVKPTRYFWPIPALMMIFTKMTLYKKRLSELLKIWHWISG